MRGLRPTLAIALVAATLAGCTDGDVVTDASTRFDAREVSIEPRDASTDDADSGDAPAGIDVTLVDVGQLADAGGAADSAPRADVDPYCRQSAEGYALAVREAQSCMSDADCQTPVCETLCCTCRVRVNADAAAFARVATERERWRAYGCDGTLECPAIPCEVDTGAVCSAEGRCVTLRGAAGDAGAFSDASPWEDASGEALDGGAP
ncbi:MAG: hypothetical protein R3A52_33115 [Polyangiales bacterium]